MQTHENEFGKLPESHQSPVRRQDEASGAASEALARGRTDALNPAAVMHLQKIAGNASVSSALEEEREEPSVVKEVVGSGGGSPLDRETRRFMESRLGADFSDVRVHTDAKATESAQSVRAHAYTVGTDVVFQSDKYHPESDSGKRMLAHELTHVVQQKSGPVEGTPAPGGIKISHPSDSFEQAAERSADLAMSPSSTSSPAPLTSTSVRVQRQDEEEELQGSLVQRQEEEAEEEEVQGAFVQRQEEEVEEEEPAAG